MSLLPLKFTIPLGADAAAWNQAAAAITAFELPLVNDQPLSETVRNAIYEGNDVMCFRWIGYKGRTNIRITRNGGLPYNFEDCPCLTLDEFLVLLSGKMLSGKRERPIRSTDELFPTL